MEARLTDLGNRKQDDGLTQNPKIAFGLTALITIMNLKHNY
jgi:hypothetical protein